LSADLTGNGTQLLEVKELVTGYGGTPTVRGISLGVGPGMVILVLGANGSGKSTLLKGIVGMLPIQSGQVLLEGKDVTGLRTDLLAKQGMGYVPQSDDTFASLTVRENLELGGYLLGRKRIAKRVVELFEEFPLIGALRGRTVANLSGGERKLVGIARALMLRPRLLVMDEPTASLTPEMSEVILQRFVRQLADAGTAVLLVEQKAMEALAVADWTHVLVSGQIAISEHPEQLRDMDRLAAAFLGGSDDA